MAGTYTCAAPPALYGAVDKDGVGNAQASTLGAGDLGNHILYNCFVTRGDGVHC